jgi:nitrilase
MKKIIHKKVKVGVIQATPSLFDIEKSVELVIEWINKGAEQGCELLLFPESFIPCYPRGLSYDAMVGRRTDKSRDQWLHYWENSIEENSEFTQKINKAIAEANLFVGLGVTERENVGGSLHCALWYFDQKGNLVGKHRKLKPTGLERYIWAESDGSTLTTLQTDIGKVGGLICWENYMPLARMAMYQQGVEIYLAPTADSENRGNRPCNISHSKDDVLY